jgi:hypothetical protein
MGTRRPGLGSSPPRRPRDDKMLESLTLTNYRCFGQHKIRFGPLNVVVGLNNAGKTTVAEALRVISVAAGRFRHCSWHVPASWLPVPKRLVGCSVSLDNLQIRSESLFHRYGEPPAIAEADFGSRGRLRVYIGGEKRVHCVLYDGSGTIVRTQQKAKALRIPTLDTLPQVAPVATEEKILVPNYVRGALSSRLAPLHFRNQLNLLSEHFTDFQETVEATWPGLRVVELMGQGGALGSPLNLEIRDGDFVGEIALMGHGLQMWLQTIWFLTRASECELVVLDEPDVYMHADLQRKLIRYVRSRFQQIILTTHSTEIMAEVPPDSIVVIDRARPESARAESLPAVQRVMSALGSAHNVHLARLWSAKRFVIVEGKDLRLLQTLQNVVDPRATVAIDALPNGSLGGWGNWQYALGSSFVLQNSEGLDIRTYCILDSDYHCPAQLLELRERFADRHVELHVWERKELENYLLVPSAICRAVVSRAAKRTTPPDTNEVAAKLDEIAASLEDDLLDGVAQEFLASDRRIGVSGANQRARAFIREKRARCGVIGMVSAKEVFRRLFGWLQQEFGVSLTIGFVAQGLTPQELPDEVTRVLSAIERCEPFRPQEWPEASE